jgi:hypothetical protein
MEWCGACGGPTSWSGGPDATTIFPNYVDVERVRIYQQQ